MLSFYQEIFSQKIVKVDDEIVDTAFFIIFWDNKEIFQLMN